MRFSIQPVIDAACALIFIALLIVPMLATQPYQPQTGAHTNAHRVSASASRYSAARPVGDVAHAK